MSQLNAYINFNGQCREALTFYSGIIGGEVELMPVAGSPAEAECPPTMQDQILHGALVREGLLLMGTDMSGSTYVHGNNIALALSCTSEADIQSCFSKLSEGGSVMHALKVEFWGATFGVVVDKFGIQWMLTYDEKIQRN